MKQLEKKGIIEKYIAIVDFSKFGYKFVRLYLKLQNTTPEIEKNIIDYLMKSHNALFIFKRDGDYDFSISYLVKTLQEYQDEYEKFLKLFSKYCDKKNVAVFLNYVHFNRNYLVDKEHHDLSSVSTSAAHEGKYDSKDIELINLIKENARISLLELSKKLKITPTGAKYKLRNLEKNGFIAAYKLKLASHKLGYEYYKVFLELEDINILQSIKQYLRQHPNIIYLNILVGGSDVEFGSEFKSQEEFYKVIDELKTLFPEKIRRYFYYKSLKIYRTTYFPDMVQ